MATIYAIRTRMNDKDQWSQPSFYRTKKRRDRIAAINRVVGGIRNHCYSEKVSESEAEDKCK